MFTFFLSPIFVFVAAASFKFKEEYKVYRDAIFKENGVSIPEKWGISRQRNHEVFYVLKWIAALALLFSAVFGMLYGIALPFIGIIIALLVFLPLGITCGKHICRIAVKRQCKKFNIPYVGI